MGEFAPDIVERLVAEASQASRSARDRHQLEGVADACEALGIALHAAELHAAGLAPGMMD